MKPEKKVSIDPENKEAVEKAKESLSKEKLDLFDVVMNGDNAVSSTKIIIKPPFPDGTFVRRV